MASSEPGAREPTGTALSVLIEAFDIDGWVG